MKSTKDHRTTCWQGKRTQCEEIDYNLIEQFPKLTFPSASSASDIVNTMMLIITKQGHHMIKERLIT